MTSREIFKKIMNYEKVNRLPTIAFENFEESVINQWKNQGLPTMQSPAEFLGMDRIIQVPINIYPYPEFDKKIISEDENYTISLDFMGSTVKRTKSHPDMYYGFIDYPVKNRDDWERYKDRFQSSPERLPKNFAEEMKRLNASDQPVMLFLYPFFFRLGFYSMGMERFMTAFYDMPDLIHDMFDFWSRFLLDTITPILPHVEIDISAFPEDLAYKNGPHISPQIYKEFFLPYQNILVDALKKNGTSIISMWTSGNIDVLLPTMMENGINCFLILEQQAGMDPVMLRKKYGRGLRMIGGISKEVLIAGPGMIDREIEHIMPVIEDGGYIPAIDDMIPPEVPFSHYIHYVKRMQDIRL